MVGSVRVAMGYFMFVRLTELVWFLFSLVI